MSEEKIKKQLINESELYKLIKQLEARNGPMPEVNSDQTPEASRDAASLLQCILDSIAEGVVVVDEKGKFLVFNQAAERILGIGPTDTSLDEWAETYRTFLVDRVTPIPVNELPLLRAMRGEELRDVEVFMCNPKVPEGLFARATSSPFKGGNGNLKGAVVIFQDITEHKRLEKELRQREENFRQLTEHIQEAFWLTDPTKKQKIYVSPGFERIWGVAWETLYEKHGSILPSIHPEDRERVGASFSKQIRGEYDEEYRVVRPDGSVRWVRDRGFPIRNESGEVYRIAGIAEDITERKRLEKGVTEPKQSSR